jgi:hypothetical protein
MSGINTHGSQARLDAIHAADAALDRAVKGKRALLLDGSLTSDGYCAECWKIITVRKEAARRIEREHPVIPYVRVAVESWGLR